MNILKETFIELREQITRNLMSIQYAYITLDNGIRLYYKRNQFQFMNDCLNSERMERKLDKIDLDLVEKIFFKGISEQRRTGMKGSLLDRQYMDFFFNIDGKYIQDVFINAKESNKILKVYNPYECVSF